MSILSYCATLVHHLQLPTVIMYENGEEQMRLPRKKSKELTRDSMVRAFELDMRLAISMRSHKEAAPADTK
jgi:hypothetical protein